jgi:hypothetical protein
MERHGLNAVGSANHDDPRTFAAHVRNGRQIATMGESRILQKTCEIWNCYAKIAFPFMAARSEKRKWAN